MHARHAAWVLLVASMACHRTAPSTASTTPPTTQAPPDEPASATPPANEHAVDPLSQPWALVVVDGSGNGYTCRRDDTGAMTFVYSPMTPERSSSGMYSGGDPRQGPLTDAQAAAVWREVAVAVARTEGHLEGHAKGTVAIGAKGPTTAEVVVDGPTGAALLGVLGLFGR